MNERIKELAEQAGFGEQWFEEHPTGCSLPKPLMLREFAELIVRECLGIIDEEGSHEGGSIRSMEAIKTHFGVEY
jgi:hypothetical protein